jgi:hypothetical protein
MHSRIRGSSFVRSLSFAGLIAGLIAAPVAVLTGVVAMSASSAFAQDRYLPPSIPRPQAAAPRPNPPPVAAAPAAAAPTGPTATVTSPPATDPNQPVAGESLLRLFAPEEPARVGAPAASGTAAGGMGDGAAGPAARFQPNAGGGRPSRGGSDPTSPGPDLRKLMGTGDEQRPAGPPPLPEITLRARVFARGRPPVAIIEIGGKQFSVREDSVLQVPLGAGGAAQLQVVEVSSAGGVHIKVVDRDQVIILN